MVVIAKSVLRSRSLQSTTALAAQETKDVPMPFRKQREAKCLAIVCVVSVTPKVTKCCDASTRSFMIRHEFKVS